MEELLVYIAKSLVDNPESVRVVTKEENDEVVLELSVDPGDMGKIIGKQGRMARAIRAIVKAAAVKDGQNVRYNVEII